MTGIYLAALLTTVAAAAIFGTVIHKLRLPANERMLWLAAVLALPLQPLAFYFVRAPLDHWLVTHLGSASATYRWLVTFYAPLTEEAAKLVPLLVPAVRRDIRPENFIRYALAIGVGFAIGEMWFVAGRIAGMSEFSGLPFYQFGRYVGESFRQSDRQSVSASRLPPLFSLFPPVRSLRGLPCPRCSLSFSP